MGEFSKSSAGKTCSILQFSTLKNKTKIEGKLDDLQQTRTWTWMSKCLPAMETENKQVGLQLWIYLFLFITLELTLESWAIRGEKVTQPIKLCIHLGLGCLVCYSEEEEDYCNIPQGCVWGWGSPTATDKDLDRESPGVRTSLDLRPGFGPAQSSTVSKVTMGCNMCVVQKPEEQYRVMFQVSNASYHLSLSVCLTCFHSFQAKSFIHVPLLMSSLLLSHSVALSYSDAVMLLSSEQTLMMLTHSFNPNYSHINSLFSLHKLWIPNKLCTSTTSVWADGNVSSRYNHQVIHEWVKSQH